jgi:hypothetical protein
MAEGSLPKQANNILELPDFPLLFIRKGIAHSGDLFLCLRVFSSSKAFTKIDFGVVTSRRQ